MVRVCARNYHNYTHLILALGIVREPMVWGGGYYFKILLDMTLALGAMNGADLVARRVLGGGGSGRVGPLPPG